LISLVTTLLLGGRVDRDATHHEDDAGDEHDEPAQPHAVVFDRMRKTLSEKFDDARYGAPDPGARRARPAVPGLRKVARAAAFSRRPTRRAAGVAAHRTPARRDGATRLRNAPRRRSDTPCGTC